VIISAVWIGIAMFVDVLGVEGALVDVKIEYLSRKVIRVEDIGRCKAECPDSYHRIGW
jgi:hypothetical protein